MDPSGCGWCRALDYAVANIMGRNSGQPMLVSEAGSTMAEFSNGGELVRITPVDDVVEDSTGGDSGTLSDE